jgi:hypothetical protein
MPVLPWGQIGFEKCDSGLLQWLGISLGANLKSGNRVVARSLLLPLTLLDELHRLVGTRACLANISHREIEELARGIMEYIDFRAEAGSKPKPIRFFTVCIFDVLD